MRQALSDRSDTAPPSTAEALRELMEALEVIGRDHEEASARAGEIGLLDPKGRLDAFQDGDVCTRGERQYPDDFFGWAESI